LAADLIDRTLATAEELKEIDNKIQAVIDDAVDFAEKSREPDPSELYRFIYAEDE
jgi:pyruvate dehydrogenase E1 component alpha subunit